MSVPTSEVGYTSAMPRREDHEVHKDMWGHWGKKNIDLFLNSVYFKNGDRGWTWFWELSELGYYISPYNPVEERLKNKHA